MPARSSARPLLQPGERRRRRSRVYRRSAAATATASFPVGGADGGGPGFRVRTQPFGYRGDADPCRAARRVAETLRQLLLIELLVSLAVVAASPAPGSWLVRLGLRPLARIEDDAAAIGAGDLCRRVEPDADPRTEVGRLGAGAERDARPDRGARSPSAPRPRAAAAVRRRRVARAAHAAERRPGLRGAVRARRPRAPRGPGAGDGRHRARVAPDGRAGRRPAAARAARPGPAAASACRSTSARSRATRSTPRARSSPTRPFVARRSRARRGAPATRTAAPGASTTCSRTCARTRRPARRRASALPAERAARVLEVADSGPGLRRGTAARVFERFYRVDPSRVARPRRLGAGARDRGRDRVGTWGRASVESSVGSGARFVVSFPPSPLPQRPPPGWKRRLGRAAGSFARGSAPSAQAWNAPTPGASRWCTQRTLTLRTPLWNRFRGGEAI